MLPNNVKLVIWDLDDTFWSGTLAEGEITPVPANHDIVVTLARRGVMSSVCSKNNFEEAAARLKQLDVWDYFIFPRIEFGPKGANIAAIIETAGLRAENVLFIDDNRLNLEEAKQFSPGLMTADPAEILPTLLDLPQVKGKDDSHLTRLKQYKNLEVKAVERASSSLGHEEFLRQCGITVEFDYEIEKNFDRLLELANRTNQLNFTKQRLETPESVAALRNLLASFGMTAGLIKVSDKYGDYGYTGYFVLQRNSFTNKLHHFAFSCRTMNMGIEQYVYEELRRPSILIAPPVANPISTFEKVDWITEGRASAHRLGHAASGKRLLLLGGCELQQLSSICSSSRIEFVNTVRDKSLVRFDDSCFITGDRDRIKKDAALKKLNYWTYEDTQRFDAAVATSEIMIVALIASMSWKYFETPSGTRVRIAAETIRRKLRLDGKWFVRNFRHVKLSTSEKLDSIAKALDHLAASSPSGAKRFALGVNTKKLLDGPALAEAGWPDCLNGETRLSVWLKQYNGLQQRIRAAAARHLFNRFVEDYCARTGRFTFIDVDSIVAEADVLDPNLENGLYLPDHFSRRGYIAIAA